LGKPAGGVSALSFRFANGKVLDARKVFSWRKQINLQQTRALLSFSSSVNKQSFIELQKLFKQREL
jgi:hypothetical protein